MVNSLFKRAVVNIYFQTGIAENGKAIKKRQTLQYVSQNANPTSIASAANAIASLYNGQLVEVEVVSNELIV